MATTVTGVSLTGAPSMANSVTYFATGGLGGLQGGTGQAISAAVAIVGSGLSNASSAATLGIVTTGFTGDLIISSIISGTGTGSWIKSGAGVLAFTGTSANTVTSPICVDAGTLVLAMQAKVAAYSGILDINGFASNAPATVEIGSAFTQLNAGTGIIVNGPAATLDIGTLVPGSSVPQTAFTLDVRGGTVKTGGQTLALSGTLTGLPGAVPISVAAAGVQSSLVTGNLSLAATQSFAATDQSTACQV